MTCCFSAQGHLTKVLKASPGGVGVTVLEKEICFTHVHDDHLFLTRSFLVFFSSNSSNLPEAFDRDTRQSTAETSPACESLKRALVAWHVW